MLGKKIVRFGALVYVCITYCNTYRYSVNHHSGNCTLTSSSRFSVMVFVKLITVALAESNHGNLDNHFVLALDSVLAKVGNSDFVNNSLWWARYKL